MKLRITIHGNVYEVDVEVLDTGESYQSGPLPRLSSLPGQQQQSPPAVDPSQKVATPSSPRSTGDSKGLVNSPIAGTILEIKCKVGESVKLNQELLVIEAMKMETSIAAPVAGVVASIDITVGAAVREGQTLIHLE
ncbi:MAG: biotin/lipoyl-containing protein [bacterium]